MRVAAKLFLAAIGAVLLPAAQGADPALRARLQRMVAGFEQGVTPLYVLGDVNEDGAVDAKDLALIEALAKPGAPPRDASCAAAGDLNGDGLVDGRDAALLRRILAAGRVAAPPLASHSQLPCSFRAPLFAAWADALPGGVLPFRFIVPALTPKNTTVKITGGDASIQLEKDGSGYVVSVGKNAPSGSRISLSITTPGPFEYLYDFTVREMR